MTKINSKKHLTKKGVVKRNPRNLYIEYTNKIQDDITKFPMQFAFSDEQLEEGLKELGIKKSEALSIGSGGFIRKSDKEKYIAMIERHNQMREELMKNEKFVYQMFRYELANHEFCITMDYRDTLDSVGLTMNEVNKNKMLKKQLIKARNDYMKNVEC